MEDEESVERDYLMAAMRRSQLRRERKIGRANWEHDRLHDLLKNRVRKLPDGGAAILKRMARHDDAEVRILAAASLLAVDEDFAVGILEQIAAGDGPGCFDAKMTLKEWRKGNLREYWA